jgi:cobalt/nickel transport system ATP-binding protein
LQRKVKRTRKLKRKSDRPIMEVDGLRFSYPNGAPVLRDVNLVIRSGEVVALLGENGAGKTTLLKHLIGLLEQHEGTIRFKGRTVARKNLQKVREAVGFVFQNPDDQLFNPTVFEDVAFGPLNMGLDDAEVKRRALRALDMVGLGDKAERSPHELSFGEKKLACIAGIMAMEPEVLVLDEPTANLDPRSRRRVVSLLKRLNEAHGRTVLFCTHNVNIIPELAKRVVVLHKGSIILDTDVRDAFGHEEELERAHMEVPEAAAIINGLRKSRPEVRPALTAKEAIDSIRSVIGGEAS